MPLFSARAALSPNEVIADLQPRIELEKAEHIKRAVRIAKRGFERIEKLWDEREAVDSKAKNLTAATLDRHDTIMRRNLGMNESPERSSAVNLSVLSGGRAVVQVNQKNA